MTKNRLITCPHCGGDLEGQLDGRAEFWQCRLRLYDMEVNPDEPMPGADSDGDLPPEQPGATKVRGLWKVLSNAAINAAEYHGGGALRGFSAEDQEKKLRGIKSTLSRNHGRATFRVQYDTAESFRPDPNHVPRYLARIDVLKGESSNE